MLLQCYTSLYWFLSTSLKFPRNRMSVCSCSYSPKLPVQHWMHLQNFLDIYCWLVFYEPLTSLTIRLLLCKHAGIGLSRWSGLQSGAVISLSIAINTRNFCGPFRPNESFHISRVGCVGLLSRPFNLFVGLFRSHYSLESAFVRNNWFAAIFDKF